MYLDILILQYSLLFTVGLRSSQNKTHYEPLKCDVISYDIF